MRPYVHGGTFWICIQMIHGTHKVRRQKAGVRRWETIRTETECPKKYRTEAKIRRHMRRCHGIAV